MPAMRSLSYGSGRVEEAEPVREGREAQRQILDDRAAEVAAAEHHPLVAQALGHERVEVAAVGGHVVEAVGPDLAVAEAAEVRDDDLEAGRGQRLDHAPPDPLGLRPPVDEEERHAARAFAHERLLEAPAAEAVHREPLRIDVGVGHRAAR